MDTLLIWMMSLAVAFMGFAVGWLIGVLVEYITRKR